MPVLAQHQAATVEWGTPPAIVELAREVMGNIDCDPCSSEYWNQIVRAELWMDAEDDALFCGAWPLKMRSFLINPPGGLVKEFWRFATERWLGGAAVFWCGFSLEQMLYLQRDGLFYEGFVRCIPRRRLAYLKRVDGGPPVPGKAPSHGSYLCLMPSSDEQVARFRELARAFGEVF